MSLIKKLSDVLKEVFWIKPARVKKSPKRSKVIVKKARKKIVRKTKTNKVKATPATVKPPKPLKSVKTVKLLKPKVPIISKSKKPQLDPALVKVGEITHYFDRIKVCVVKITQGTVLIGDKLTMVGSKSKFVQKVWSMQIESLDVKVAKKGQLIGLKVDKQVTVGDIVYK